LFFVSLAASANPPAPPGEVIALPGLTSPVRVLTDASGVRHLFAENDLDLARAQGFVHARDRFFQMDVTRRSASGDLAELVGPSVIPSDIQNRTIGLRRAAERSLTVLSASELALLQAYADGVNAFLAAGPLPIEYGALELTTARSWTPVDSLVIGKAIAASLSLDIDIGAAEQLAAYVAAGNLQGFDGEALFFEDVRRLAPIDPSATLPDAGAPPPYIAKRFELDGKFLAKAGAASKAAREQLEQAPNLALALDRRDSLVGSNEWGVAAQHSQSGKPMIANDPHLSLDAPSTFYEIHLTVASDPSNGPMNVSGVAFPGAPGVILGQNERISWGATTNPMDVSDVFLDTLVVDPVTTCAAVGSLACVISDGVPHPVQIQFGVVYRANQVGNGVPNDVVPVPVPAANQIIATVPFRSFGPILNVTNPAVLTTGGVTTALVLQYTGFHATRELSTFAAWNRAANLAEFRAALDDFDVGSQNWAYVDVDGNLAYFTSAELPLRRDLEAGSVFGAPPFFVRDGSGPANWVEDPARSQGQAIPFAVLPSDEMPQLVNPPAGWFVNANNDPAGTSLDNDPLNQHRSSDPGAIYYLNPSYANGLRSGRITRLLRSRIDRGQKVHPLEMVKFQANTQQLDAELLTPFLVRAFKAALLPGAPAQLAALASDPRIAEAAGRLRTWNFETPTGIEEGYDWRDHDGRRTPGIPAHEARSSVAATIYNVWRAKVIRSVVDARLTALGVPGVGSGDGLKAVHHLLVQEPFTGVGASGVDFFPGPAGLTAAERRDFALLDALRVALDALAGPDFADAFGGSTNQQDYRWGRLHRVTFDHPLGGPFSIPPAAGYSNLSAALPGISRDGGYEVVNASGFSAKADRQNDFRFGGGPVRRYVGVADGGPPHTFGGVFGRNSVPGGPSGNPTSPEYATQLGPWLTADPHLVRMGRMAVEASAVSAIMLTP
jgi:penicillin amidase